MILLSGSRTRASRLAEDLPRVRSERLLHERWPKPGGCNRRRYSCLWQSAPGFAYPQIKFTVITEGDMFGKEKKKRKRKRRPPTRQEDPNFTELSVGDYVVHEDRRGDCRGIEKIEQDVVIKDYLKVEYADNEACIFRLPAWMAFRSMQALTRRHRS